MDEHIILLLSLLMGWGLDLIFGDPINLPHPVVYMGKWIAKGEHLLNCSNHRIFKGAIFAVFSIFTTFAVPFVLLKGIRSFLGETHQETASIILLLIQSILVFYCLAGKTLRNEVKMVFEATDRSLEDGRKQVARIVGRDTQQLSAQEVRTAALETLAENLSDGVIAPLFWFCILGVPGMLAYKMVNTLDSMIGYKNVRYKDFGCWAAHIDDVANYLPARITAFIMVLIGWCHNHLTNKGLQSSIIRQYAFVLKYGPQHASPNSGWPEAALAGILNCRFGGTHNYFGEEFYKPYIGCNKKELNTQDMQISINICLLSEIFCIALVSVLLTVLTISL